MISGDHAHVRRLRRALLLATSLITLAGCIPSVAPELPDTFADRDLPSVGPLVDDLSAADLQYWRDRPPLAACMSRSLTPRLSNSARAAVAQLKSGWFRPSGQFEWLELGVPPPWDVNPVHNNTWDLWRHSLTWTEPLATHTRRLTFRPPGTIEICDELTAADGRPHVYAQLFHAAGDLEIESVSDEAVCLKSADGSACFISQTGGGTNWRVVEGETEPKLQGWNSPGFGEFAPASMLRFANTTASATWTFQTTIELQAVSP